MSNVLTPGQIFAGRYRIDRFLAQGGFGAVFVAEQIETELKVALKVLWPHVLSSEESVEKFKMEARIAGRVGSEHIVKVFDAGFDDTTRMPFLVMELLQGGDLEGVVERSGPLAPDQVITYMRQVASALDKAHNYVDRDGNRAPIIHRDLKPENLFLTHRETGEPLVKVLDFGIAKILGDSQKMSQEVKGTPLYMAFEQATGGPMGPETDVWALGLIAFFLLTGRSYWKSASLPEASVAQLFSEVLTLPIEPATTRATALGIPVVLPGKFDEWFSHCVDREPRNRFRSAGDCVVALGKVWGGSDTLPGPGTRVSDARPNTLVSSSPAMRGTDASLAMERNTPTGSTPVPMKSGSKLPLVAAAVLLLGGGAAMALRGSGHAETATSPVTAAPAVASAAPVMTAAPAMPAPVVTPEPTPSAAPPAAAATSEPAATAPPATSKAVRAKPAAAAPPKPGAKKADLYSDR